MRLKIALENSADLRRPLALLVNLRKICVFRFTDKQLVIISSAFNEPQVWIKLDSSLFPIYEVVSTRHNVIPFEINIEPLYQVLKNYERSRVTSNLSIRLQRRSPTDSDTGGERNKAVASLALFYTEQITMNSTISHSFNIPVRLLRADNDRRIQEPTIDDMKIAVKLPNTLIPMFQRAERYKMSDMVTIVCNRVGQMRFLINEGERRVDIQWKGRLETSVGDDEDGNDGNDTRIQDSAGNEDSYGGGSSDKLRSDDLTLVQPVSLKVRLRYWNIGCKLIELCDAMSLIIHDTGCILHCYIDEDQKCDITYYINGQIDPEELD